MVNLGNLKGIFMEVFINSDGSFKWLSFIGWSLVYLVVKPLSICLTIFAAFCGITPTYTKKW